MFRSLYIGLLQLHPGPFRQRFGDEMLESFDCARGMRAVTGLFCDALLSLFRQWVLRSEFRRPVLAAGDAQLFRTIDPYKPRPAALLNGAILTIGVLCGVVVLISQNGKIPVFLVGVHRATPRLISIDRSSLATSELNTTVQLPADAEDPLKSVATIYFKAIRVLDVLDANHDLAISAWEMTTAPAALRKLDTNHDGQLSAEECGFHLGQGDFSRLFVARARSEYMRENPVLAALDADHNGVISAREIENSAAALKTLDRNGDGSLTAEELLPQRDSVEAAAILLQVDINGDGVISPAEIDAVESDQVRAFLVNADRNHDGFITRSELVKELRLRAAGKKQFDDARRAAGFR